MTDTNIGTAMQLHDGSLSVIVAREWKDRLVDLLTCRGIDISTVQRLKPVEPPSTNFTRPVEYEIVIQGEECDFIRWSAELSSRPVQ